jgi:opacity protein-like surface antigen
MKKLVLVAVLLFGFSVLAVAQDVPVAEVFGGYSYVRVNPTPEQYPDSFNLNGFSTSVAFNVNKIAGVVADFGGYYGSIPNTSDAKIHIHSLMFGPRINVRKGKVTPYVQALFGYAHSAVIVNDVNQGKENDFAMAFGGGVDINVNKLISVRPVQIEYVGIKSGQDLLNNMRFSAGIVFKLGKR